MGRFLNPDNSAFQVALNSEIYVDKTGLLEYTNRVMGTKQGYICNSRPRRFGKSITADMLTAYYSRGCSSREMFEKLNIGKSTDFLEHLNRYDVIHLDIQWFLATVDSVDEVINFNYGQRACRIAGELSGCFAGRGKYSTGCAFAAQGRKRSEICCNH